MGDGGGEARTLRWRGRGDRLALLLLGVVALGIALNGVVSRPAPPLRHLTLTAGNIDSTRALVARRLDEALDARGFETRLVDTASSAEEIERVDRGEVDLALVSGAYRVERYPNVRLVAPLYVEALHLLVKAEMAGSVGHTLDGLHGHTVDIGPEGSTTAGLAQSVLDFAGLPPASPANPSGYRAQSLTLAEMEALYARGERDALPDAILHLGTVPAKLAQGLIRNRDYTLVPLPFAEPLRLGVLLSGEPDDGPAANIDLRHITETVIPPFTYALDPPSPAAPLTTIGARLLLVANESVPSEAIERVIDVVYGARIAQLASPPLDPSVLALPSSLEAHDGTLAYRRRQTPFLTDNTVSALNNSLGVLGALAGGGWFLWQWWRQRVRARRDETFGIYMLRVADVERRIATLELAAELELEPLADLQRELLELKREALERFAEGELGDQGALSDLLLPINAARDHIGNLILHIRDSIEEQAESEGRTATEVWEEAIDKPEE
jgi:TRAP-type uncharacterized transport system substrate-binding protein